MAIAVPLHGLTHRRHCDWRFEKLEWHVAGKGLGQFPVSDRDPVSADQKVRNLAEGRGDDFDAPVVARISEKFFFDIRDLAVTVAAYNVAERQKLLDRQALVDTIIFRPAETDKFIVE